jgi:hypothetical protein
MRGTISFEQELRASRLASGQKKGTRSDPAPVPTPNERPWQDDIEQVQQTLREVLRAIASFSGVEIPGLPAGLQGDSAPAPKLSITTLKDRLRNDLEGFSLKTSEELANRAREQTRAALDAIQNEMGGQIEQAAAEVRGELQLPAQVDKLLQPCMQETEARLEKSVSQKFEQLIAGQQQLIQDSLRSALGSIQSQMSALEQSVQQVRELKSDSAAQTSTELNSKIEHQVAEQQRLIQEKLQSAVGVIQAQMSALEQSVQQVRELKSDSAVQSSAELNSKIDHQLAEQQRAIQNSLQTALGSLQTQMSALVAAEFRNQLQAPAQIEKLLEPCVAQAVARLESSFVPNVELLLNEQEQWIQESLQAALNSVQTHMGALEQKMREIHAVKADLVAKLSTEQPNANFEALLARQERLIQGRVESALGSVTVQMSALEQKVRQILEIKADSAAQTSAELNSRVEYLLADQERLIQGKLQNALSSVQAQMSALEQNMHQIGERKSESAAQMSVELQNAALDDAMKKYEGRVSSELEKVVHLLAERERSIQGRLQTALGSVQAQMTALEHKMEQIREMNAGFVAQNSPERPVAVVDSALKQAEISLNNGIKEFLDRSFSRIEGSFSSLMETPKFKSVQSTHAKLESLRKAIPNGSTDMLIRVQQALDNLDRLGSKDPLPPS